MVQCSDHGKGLDLARVLVVDDDPAFRLTLQTVLAAGGYQVDGAATAAEALSKMDRAQYELILSDLQMESPEAGLRVLAHAQLMAYEPAAALLTKWLSVKFSGTPRADESLLIETEDLPEFLSRVACLIAERATRMVERDLRAHSHN
ncbi:MAG TPA: response regulator [Bryobacteraceae bacterium]|nr:response regulator [Bryobacteraceae bacterium]